MLGRVYVLCLAIAVILLSTSTPADDNRAEAKRHFETGLVLIKTRDFASAAVVLKKSVELLPSKAGLFNLAYCYRELGRPIEALTLFKRLLKSRRDTLDQQTKEYIKQHIRELNKEVARLRVSANREGASITLNGKKIGRTPLRKTLVLTPGSYKISVSLEKHQTINRKLELKPGIRHTETFDFSEQADALNHKNWEDEPSEDKKFKGSPNPYDNSSDSRPSSSESLKKQKKELISKAAFWSGVAGTIVFGGVSAGMWGATAAKKNEYETLAKRYDEMDADFTETRDALYHSATLLKKDLSKYNGIAVGMTIATGAFAVTALIGAYFVFIDTDETQSSSIAATPTGICITF